MRFEWRDERLAYHNLSQVHQIEAEDWGADRIWIPTIFLTNDKSSKNIKLPSDNIYISVRPNGDVVFIYRWESLSVPKIVTIFLSTLGWIWKCTVTSISDCIHLIGNAAVFTYRAVRCVFIKNICLSGF